MRHSLLAQAAFGAALLLPSTVLAQVRPRIMIAFDTSGSMGLDFNGIPTFGDGVTTGCAPRAGAGQCGTDCTAGLDTNCDGQTNDSRIFIAKNAVADIVRAYGEVDWGLTRFSQITGSRIACRAIQDMECNPAAAFVTSFGNPLCNSGGGCGRPWESIFPPACRPGSGGLNPIQLRSGADVEVCMNYVGTCGSGSVAGDVLVGFPDMGPWLGRDNTYGILRWLDGAEPAFNGATTTGDFCSHTTTGNCELRPDGGTPLAGILTASANYMTPIRTSDSASLCRPYSVILITDGDESCGGTPTAAATALRSQGILTYVVGLAINTASRANLNAIATAGGTDAGAAGGDTAYFANDRFTLSAGLAEIVRRSMRFEVCNTMDDDCDLRVDEGVTNACGTCGAVPTEACNTRDDDCDGRTDEGVANACGTCGAAPSETCNRSDDDCDGAIDEGGVCTCPAPSSEVCDNADNDCDTRVDEGVTRACGVDTGECRTGTETCVAGVFGACTGRGPSTELCDRLDNDCDGVADGLSRPCGSSVGACRPGAETCAIGSGVWGTCTGGIGPTAELCDGIDNDCDTRVDEGDPGGGGACGSAMGVCTPGTVRCVGGTLTCSGGTSGGVETCNALDDDCDGRTDEGIASMGPCGTDEGACTPGAMVCVRGAFACTGSVGPIAERCNGLDDDCDTRVDEGNPEGGMTCGSAVPECRPGTTVCRSGRLVCDGAVGPSDEVCDGRDNDCDTLIDEDLGLGEACGTDAGECVPGFQECRDGEVVCIGATGPGDEVCDALDNDCDGTIDEGLGLGEPCGAAEGLCEPGRQMCVDGRPVCVGGIAPGAELCDCDDNDCDTRVDEGSLCPAGSACVDCQCALPCVRDEFGDRCPTGRVPVRTGEVCHCVAERCNPTACGRETIERDGAVVCAPDASGVPSCVCRSNECTFPCDGVVCSDGTVCDPRDGRCVEDSCRALGCPTGQVCDFTTGECTSDPCATAGCRADQVCRAGTCEPSCADVECAATERCVRGACVTDRCRGVSCPGGQVCDPSSGACAASRCGSVVCPTGTMCDALTGRCDPDPCLGVRCPATQVCRSGECGPRELPDGGVLPDAGFDAGVTEDGRRRALAAGGGLCSATPRGDGGAPLWLFGVVAGLLLARRRAAFPVVSTASMGVLLGGCAVDPFCFNCTERDAGSDAPVRVDVHFVRADAWRDPEDAWSAPDGCSPTATELCNRADDDCDTRIDEGIDTDTDEDHCGGCGIACAPAGAFGACVAGRCTIERCDVGRFDRNGDPTDGCEVRCLPTASDDRVCDLRDNDCDFEVDEDVELATDGSNCGRCGRVCRFIRGAALCRGGNCVLGACEPGFHDLDGMSANGCEYACATTGAETCNGRDDDCDGSIDEGDPEGGADCGSTTGACRLGRETCVAGRITCVGGVGPTSERCNGVDDDCDGTVDQDNPEGGAACGMTSGACRAGRQVCRAGRLECEGAVAPTTESCNGLDDNCDGVIDDGNPGGGAACGTDAGECTAGRVMCRGAGLVCDGEVRARVESCNGLDDDCDAGTDEDFALATNVNHCGRCGNVCRFANGLPRCTAGACALAACESGWVNANGDTSDGCEYRCSPRGSEICNGVDDDCDTRTDESLTAPTTFCNPNGVCAGTAATCGGTAGWRCSYPAAMYETVETRCDGRDNDCDGQIDEPFTQINPLTGMGLACSVGVGACRRTGTYMCMGTSAVVCSAGAAGAPTAELCNNIDDDCDGTVDNGILPSAIPTVTIPRAGGGTVRVMQYEASRPDATAATPGSVVVRACSNPNVVPWTNVTWTEARSACCALNASGTCAADGTGWRLCDAPDWTRACQGSAGACAFSYSTACSASSPLTCNGEEYDANTTASGDQDALLATASPGFPACFAAWGSERIWDLSGNAREWTSTETSAGSGTYYLRGGSYNNVEPGRSCSFDFAVATSTFAFPNTGFRCCFY